MQTDWKKLKERCSHTHTHTHKTTAVSIVWKKLQCFQTTNHMVFYCILVRELMRRGRSSIMRLLLILRSFT